MSTTNTTPTTVDQLDADARMEIFDLWQSAGLSGEPDLSSGDSKIITDHLKPAMASVLGSPATWRSAAAYAALSRLVGVLVRHRLVPVLDGERSGWRLFAAGHRPVDDRLRARAARGSSWAQIPAPPGRKLEAGADGEMVEGAAIPQRVRKAVNQIDAHGALTFQGAPVGAVVTVGPMVWTRVGTDPRDELSDVERLSVVQADVTHRWPGLYTADEILRHRTAYYAEQAKITSDSINRGQFVSGFLAGLAAAGGPR